MKGAKGIGVASFLADVVREIPTAALRRPGGDHIAIAFDLGGYHFVIITDHDLESLAPAKSKEISVDVFVPAEQIPDVMYDAG